MEQEQPVSGAVITALLIANDRVSQSLATARSLLGAGFAGPALVWAVRSVEIFVREFMVLPAYLQEPGHRGWTKALRRARRAFGRSDLRKAWRVVEREWGPLEPLLTGDGNDVIQEWIDNAVLVRHDVVHGVGPDVTESHARAVLDYAEQLIPRLRRLMLSTERHPTSALLLLQLAAVRREWDAAKRGSGVADPPVDEADET